MNLIELLIISIGLAMDATAIAVCKGLNMKKINCKYGIILAVFFGIFQAGMTAIGWVLGKQFEQYIVIIDHWIAFVLLSIIGIKMILESLKKEKEETEETKIDIKEMLILAIATSIDALAIGITFSFLQVNILIATSLIGIVTLVLSFLGVILGYKFGAKHKAKAELIGGIVLILIGIKILIEHLSI